MVKTRCPWCLGDPLYMEYHDKEWGVPLHDDHRLFEMLILEGAQAGLSWLTILRKRSGYREAFDGFDPEKMARYPEGQVNRLLQNPGIVRNRRKVESAIQNARAFLELRSEFGAFRDYLWRFVDGQPIQNQWRALGEIPARTPVSDSLSKDLKKRGFSFIGSTVCYAFMQSVGMVNDHLVDCFRFPLLNQKSHRYPEVT